MCPSVGLKDTQRSQGTVHKMKSTKFHAMKVFNAEAILMPSNVICGVQNNHNSLAYFLILPSLNFRLQFPIPNSQVAKRSYLGLGLGLNPLPKYGVRTDTDIPSRLHSC
jgi:hypothetical protein